MCDYAIRSRNRSPKTNITPDSTLTYPTHPFPPSLCELLSDLPQGFSDMALKKMLSNQVIRILYRMVQAVQKGPLEFSEDRSIAVEMMRLSMESNARQLEKVIVTLGFAFGRFLFDVTTTGRPVKSSWRTFVSMKESLRAMSQSIFDEHFDKEAGPDFIVWAVFLLASVGVEYGVPACTQDELLRRLQTKIPAVRRFESFLEMLGKFLWHEKLAPCAKEVWQRIVGERQDSNIENQNRGRC